MSASLRYPNEMYSVVGNDGQVYGPVDMATLTQWIAEGRVTPTTNLIDPLDGRVIPAGHAPALMGNFPPTPMQAPPMPGVPANPYAPSQGYQTGYPRPGMAPYDGPPKSKVAAIVLVLFLGSLGIHRFYLGHTGTGIGMLALFLAGFVTCGLTWIPLGIWHLVDLILVCTGGLREPNGRELA